MATPRTKVKAGTDLLNELASFANEPNKKEPAKKKNTKPVINCSSKHESAILDGLTSSDAVFKIAKAALDDNKNTAKSLFEKKYFELCIQLGYKPDNPSLRSENSTANLVFKHMNKVKEVQDIEALTERLNQVGFEKEVVEKITSKITQTKTTGIKNFNALMESEDPKARKAAEKLMSVVRNSLTRDELALVLETSILTTVQPDWQETAVGIAVDHAKVNGEASGVECLDMLYQMIPPTVVISQMIYKGGENIDEAFNELKAEKVKPEVPSEVEGNYDFKLKDKVVEIYKGKTIVKIKACLGADHAKNTLRKLQEDPSYLAKVLQG